MSVAPPAPGMRLSPDTHARLVAAVESFQRLLVFDHAWTALTAQLQAGGSDDATEEAVASLGGQMLVGLGAAHEGADFVRDYVLTESARRIADAAEDALSGHDEDDAMEDAWQVFVPIRESLGELTEAAYEGLVETLPQQRRALIADLGLLVEGGTPEGDLLKAVHCGLASLTIVGGLIMVAIPPWAHGAAMVTSGAAAWKVFGCRFPGENRTA